MPAVKDEQAMAATPPRWDMLIHDVHLATMVDGDPPFGAIEDGALGIQDGRLAFVGRRADLPGELEALAARVHAAGGGWATPGLIDCHTHLVYGGDRSAEFERRLKGESYADIARAGGGIAATVAATRRAGEDALVDAGVKRLASLCRDGVTTVEVKSGYALELAGELAMLRAARRLADRCPVDVVTTFLGAHALPPDFAGDADDYIAVVCDTMLPEVARLKAADAVDAFCERIAFSAAQVGRVFDAAAAHGLPVKLHADQLSDGGGAALAAAHGALSADHLEYADDAGLAAMARAGTVAVLLPGAFYYLGETRRPPVAAMRAHGVAMAVATDCNPGSSPLVSLRAALNMACVLFALTPEEALAGATRVAARALGLAGDRGTLEVGKRADIALWDVGRPAELVYYLGGDPCRAVFHRGRLAGTPYGSSLKLQA